MLLWISDHSESIAWGVGAALLATVAGLAAVGVVLVRLPADCFTPEGRARREREAKKHRGVRIARNVLGVVLVLAGLAMLMLPGPGLLVVLLGVVLADIPGKSRVQSWILSRGGILRATNRLRARFGKPPLQPPSRDAGTGSADPDSRLSSAGAGSS